MYKISKYIKKYILPLFSCLCRFLSILISYSQHNVIFAKKYESYTN